MRSIKTGVFFFLEKLNFRSSELSWAWVCELSSRDLWDGEKKCGVLRRVQAKIRVALFFAVHPIPRPMSARAWRSPPTRAARAAAQRAPIGRAPPAKHEFRHWEKSSSALTHRAEQRRLGRNSLDCTRRQFSLFRTIEGAFSQLLENSSVLRVSLKLSAKLA